MSIFISIASYQDPLLESTVFSAIHNADNPNEIISRSKESLNNFDFLNKLQKDKLANPGSFEEVGNFIYTTNNRQRLRR